MYSTGGRVALTWFLGGPNRLAYFRVVFVASPVFFFLFFYFFISFCHLLVRILGVVSSYLRVLQRRCGASRNEARVPVIGRLRLIGTTAVHRRRTIGSRSLRTHAGNAFCLLFILRSSRYILVLYLLRVLGCLASDRRRIEWCCVTGRENIGFRRGVFDWHGDVRPRAGARTTWDLFCR